MTKNNFYKNKIILVTGATGSIGKSFTKLMKENSQICLKAFGKD